LVHNACGGLYGVEENLFAVWAMGRSVREIIVNYIHVFSINKDALPLWGRRDLLLDSYNNYIAMATSYF